MTGEVVCPSCGRDNERGLAENYRVCVHCGADLGPALAQAAGMPTEVREPSMGAEPQPPLEQPYGGQPYPPPPGQPPYGGPGPPVPYPPTYHPGVYDKPEQKPYVDIGNLFKLLFHPNEAFEDLYDHTGSSQGIVLAMTFILLSAGISAMMMLAVLGSLDVPDDVITVPGSGGGSATQSVISVITGIAFFFISAYLVFTFIKSRGRRPSMERTIGMMGYAKFPYFVIAVLIAIAMPFIIGSMDLSGLEDEDPDAVMDALRSMCGSLSVVFGLFFIGFIWSIWVHSHAQSVANDVALGTAFGYVFITWIIVGIISFVIGLIVAAFIVSSAI